MFWVWLIGGIVLGYVAIGALVTAVYLLAHTGSLVVEEGLTVVVWAMMIAQWPVVVLNW